MLFSIFLILETEKNKTKPTSIQFEPACRGQNSPSDRLHLDLKLLFCTVTHTVVLKPQDGATRKGIQF